MSTKKASPSTGFGGKERGGGSGDKGSGVGFLGARPRFTGSQRSVVYHGRKPAFLTRCQENRAKLQVATLAPCSLLPAPRSLLPAPRSPLPAPPLPMEKLTPILPCRGRDDLNEPRSAGQADELLAAWTALWHPALVAAAGAMPRWTAAAAPPDDPAGHLILLPPTAEPLLPDDWLSHAEHLGARLVRGQRRRPEMIAAALAMLDSGHPVLRVCRRSMPIWRPIFSPWDLHTI